MTPYVTAEEARRAAQGHERAVESIIGVALILFGLGVHDEFLTAMFLVLGVPAASLFGHLACARLPRGEMRLSWVLAYVGVTVGDTCIGLVLLLVLVLQPFGLVRPGGPREQARRINCQSNLKQIQLACTMYAQDNGGVLPPDFQTLAAGKYLDAFKTYVCPSSRTEPGQTPADLKGPAHCDYQYFGGGRTLKELGRHAILAAGRDGNHENYFNVIFIGGWRASYRGATWYEVVREYNLPLPPPPARLRRPAVSRPRRRPRARNQDQPPIEGEDEGRGGVWTIMRLAVCCAQHKLTCARGDRHNTGGSGARRPPANRGCHGIKGEPPAFSETLPHRGERVRGAACRG